jgi:hypothetical protein
LHNHPCNSTKGPQHCLWLRRTRGPLPAG